MSLMEQLLRELEPSRLISNLTAGLVVSIVVVIVAVSLGTLIFAGELAPYLSTGLGIMLFSGVLITAMISLFSSYRGMVAYPQERVAPILAIIASLIVAELSGTVSPDDVFYTVVAAIIVASLVNGIFLSALGFFKLGALIRFIPYPVIGGFLAGTGYLLVHGSVGVMTGLHVEIAHLQPLIEGDYPAMWVIGMAFGLLIVWATHRFKQSWILPSILLGGIVGFYAVVITLGASPALVMDRGWLLGPFPPGDVWRPITLTAFTHANWTAIIGQVGNLGTILVISVISVLLNSSALELVVKQDIDLNRELKVAGIANILIGIGGGTVGFHSLSISRLVHRMGANSRMVGVIAAIACTLMLFLGSELMAYLPRLVLGGLLFFLGMHFLVEWVYEAWFRLTRADYSVVILILGVVAGFGYLHGVVVGTFACVVLFLINYSKVNVVKHALSGTHQHSNVDRPSRHTRYLKEHGEQLSVFRLQGFIFFGTANSLLEQVRQRLAHSELETLKFMVLDFKSVTGIDSSSVLSFVKMLQLAEKNTFTLIFTQLSPAIFRLLKKEGFDLAEPNVYSSFEDLDYGLEWCENEMLAAGNMFASEYEKLTLKDQLSGDFAKGINLDKLLSYFERVEVEAGHALLKQGDEPDDLYLIERGQVTAKLELGADKAHRLRTMCAGAIVGELGMILDQPRMATIVADRPTVAYRLTREALQVMEDNDPEVAVEFHHFMTYLVAERLANNGLAMRMLLD
jgi:SulP family sulfate permease